MGTWLFEGVWPENSLIAMRQTARVRSVMTMEGPPKPLLPTLAAQASNAPSSQTQYVWSACTHLVQGGRDAEMISATPTLRVHCWWAARCVPRSIAQATNRDRHYLIYHVHARSPFCPLGKSIGIPTSRARPLPTNPSSFFPGPVSDHCSVVGQFEMRK